MQGLKFWIDHVKQVLEDLDVAISHMLRRHWHIDHISGVPDLLAYRPELADRIYKHDPDGGQQPIHDGQVFQVEGATLRAVHTPGHSHDHMCFLMEEKRWFAREAKTGGRRVLIRWARTGVVSA